jgi:ribulose-phosphate 3-epimerase
MMTGEALLQSLKAGAPHISVGALAADLLALGVDIARLEGSEARLLHFDVMDGCFVPMLTAGPPLIKAIKTSLLKDVHLVIEEPLTKLGDYAAAGADLITVHVESCRHPHRVLQTLGGMRHASDPKRGILRGIAINPGTPLHVLPPLLDMVDMIELLGINPGWGGQSFAPTTFARAAEVKQMIRVTERDILLMVDGGITNRNIGEIATIGADIVVTGSAVFEGDDPAGSIRSMLEVLRGAYAKA